MCYIKLISICKLFSCLISVYLEAHWKTLRWQRQKFGLPSEAVFFFSMEYTKRFKAWHISLRTLYDIYGRQGKMCSGTTYNADQYIVKYKELLNIIGHINYGRKLWSVFTFWKLYHIRITENKNNEWVQKRSARKCHKHDLKTLVKESVLY